MRLRSIALLLAAVVPLTAAAQWTPAQPLGPDIASVPVQHREFALASDGDSYLLLTTGSRGTRAVRLDADGRILDANGIRVDGSSATRIALAGNGTDWLILRDDVSGLLRANGTVDYASNVRGRNLAAVSNGRNFLVWSAVTRQVTLLEPDLSTTYPDLAALPSSFDAVASNGDAYCIAGLSGPTSVSFNIIDAAGRPRFAAPRTIEIPVTAGRAMRRIALTRVHDRFVLLWSEYEMGGDFSNFHDVPWAIRGLDIDANGERSGDARVIASGTGRARYGDSTSTAVTLAVTQAGPADAIITFWAPGSTSLLQTTLGCGATFETPFALMASNGRTSVLASRSSAANGSAVATRSAAFACDPATLVAAPEAIATWGTPEQSLVSLVAGRADAAVMWFENESPGRTYARRVSHDGQPLGFLQLPDEAANGHGGWQHLRTATDGWSYVAAWRAADDQPVHFARLTDAGAPAPQVVAIDAVRSYDFDIAWTGEAFAVVWSEADWRIRGILLDRDGTALEPPFDIVSADNGRYRSGVTLARGATELLVAWYEGGTSLLPCSGCQNPQHVYALRLDTALHPMGDAAEIGGYDEVPREILWGGDAWYVRLQNVFTKSQRRVARIDASGVHTGDSGALALVPLGRDRVGVFRGTSLDELDASMTASWFIAWTHRTEELQEAVFVSTASGRLLAVFTARDPAPPHNGSHRAFVTSLLLHPPTRRRAVR